MLGVTDKDESDFDKGTGDWTKVEIKKFFLIVTILFLGGRINFKKKKCIIEKKS